MHAVSAELASALARTRARSHDVAETLLLQRLRDAALSIHELPTVHGMLERLAEQACELVGARRGAVGLSPGGSELVDVVTIDKAAGETRAVEPRLRIALQELVDDGRVRPPYLGVRLHVNSHSIGSVCLFDKADGAPFDEHDEHVLDLFGSQAALAIEYAQQLARTQEAQRMTASTHDELAASIAHDMRTPISSILLQLDLLLECGEQRGNYTLVPTAALQRLRDGGWRVSRMVDDLLDASRIELRRVALDRHRLSLPDAIASLVAELEPTLAGRAIRLDVEDGVPLVWADPLRLDEIVTNLVENAAKYSDPGAPITLHVQSDGDGATLTVEDEGAGILAEEIPMLFDRFFQSKRPRAKKSGLGIGLYITKGLVEAHGGRVWVDSQPGEGSRFHVWLPCVDPEDAVREA